MLLRLQIRDLALIDAVELDFEHGLTVLTGETGAGKSILVDALALVLGDRADAAVVRHGAQRAEVGAAFDVAALPDVADKLRELALDDGDECLLRRVVGADGRTRAFVNGAAVPLATLREVGELLLDLHGQQAHQSLLQRAVQRAVLDHHGDLAAPLARVRACHDAWREARDALAALDAGGAGGEARAELLAHHVAELRALALAEGEVEKLDAEHRVLAHRGRLAEDAQRALAALGQDDGDSAGTRLVHEAARALAGARAIDPRLADAHEMTQSAAIQLEEAARALAHYLDALEVDPAELARVEARLASIHDVARKHRVAPAELLAHATRLEAELDTLTHADARRAELRRRLADAERAYAAAAEALSEGRARAAARLAQRVDEQLAELGMRGAHFDVELTRPAEARFGPEGLDQVTFLVAANPGQPPRPLAKVASGGELARIGLALQVVAAGASRIPCLVFDEVDSGIGGGVAEIVGRRLRALGEERQVLAVTHLPQVASQAHRHLRVTKHQDGERAHIRVDALDEDAKVEELARMLGGIEITRRTREHAREMRERAAAPRGAGSAHGRRRR
jgi:DNA repair protein RecN (Recombination protein N)